MNEAIEAEEISVVEMCGGKRMIEARELVTYGREATPTARTRESAPRSHESAAPFTPRL